MIEKIYIDQFDTNPDTGSVTVSFHVNDEPANSHSQMWSSYESMILDNQSFLITHEIGVRVALAMWLGADPTGGNQSLATEFRVEIDPTALVSVRRVLDV